MLQENTISSTHAIYAEQKQEQYCVPGGSRNGNMIDFPGIWFLHLMCTAEEVRMAEFFDCLDEKKRLASLRTHIRLAYDLTHTSSLKEIIKFNQGLWR